MAGTVEREERSGKHQPGRMGLLLRTARLQFLPAGLAIFLLGGMLAVLSGARFDLLRFILGCLIVLPAQLSVNLGNDYFDMVSDSPSGATFISGGAGILPAHPQLRPLVLGLSLGLIAFSLAVGLVFLFLYHYPPWMYILVILGNALGWIYSAPPLRLMERGWGEIDFIFILGFLLPAMGYLAVKGSLDMNGFVFLLPILLYGMNFILSVEIPDLEDDRSGGKRTWVTALGRKAGFAAIGGLALLASLYFFAFMPVLPRPQMIDGRVIGFLSFLPLAPALAGLFARPSDRSKATPIAVWIVLGLFGFLILVDIYLVSLAVGG